MTWSQVWLNTMISIFDHVEGILTSIGAPILLGVMWIALLHLFLHFKN